MNRQALLIAMVSGLCLGTATSAQTITITGPTPGEVFYVGDTVNVTYEIDEGYVGIGTVIQLSVDGGRVYHHMFTLESPNFGAIPLTAEHSGNVHVVIPDSLGKEGPKVSTISENALFKVYDYGDGDKNDKMDAPFSIRHPSERATEQESEEENSGPCGSGAGLAFIPAIALRSFRRRRRRRA
jgi:hypothetical protein